MNVNRTNERNSENRRRKTGWLVPVVAGAVLVIVIRGGIRDRIEAAGNLAVAAEQQSIVVVDVVHPGKADSGGELVLPGTAQAYIDTPVYARTSGYLKSWHFDIGARVRKGQLLAEIDAPELDHQLQKARADLSTAEANLRLAVITANRDQRLLKTGSVSIQEHDNALASMSAGKAIVESNRAEVARLEQLQSFERVYAPFDGVVTARNTDFGALIDAGASTAKELFRVGSVDRLRVFVSIPEVWSRAARTGMRATLSLAEFQDESFPCTLARTSGSIDPGTRTLLAEFEVNNRSGRLLPGAYVQVHMKLPAGTAGLTLPSNTLLFRAEGMRAGVVSGGRVHLVPIRIGRDYGASVEVAGGLNPDDQVILDPPDSLSEGAVVQVRAAQGAK